MPLISLNYCIQLVEVMPLISLNYCIQLVGVMPLISLNYCTQFVDSSICDATYKPVLLYTVLRMFAAGVSQLCLIFWYFSAFYLDNGLEFFCPLTPIFWGAIRKYTLRLPIYQNISKSVLLLPCF